MIELHTTRQYCESAIAEFFPYLNLQKQTRLNNVAHRGPASAEYLLAVAFNCLIEEVHQMILKKLFNNRGYKIKLQLTDAQAAIFYRALLDLPIDSEKVYLQMIRNQWVLILDGELQKKGHIKSKGKPLPLNDAYVADDWI